MDRGAWWATVHRARVRHDLAAKLWPYVLRVVYGHKKWETVCICYLYNQKKKTNRTNSMETGKTSLWFVRFVHVGDSPLFSFRSRGVPWKYTHMLLMFSASAPLEYHWWHTDGCFFPLCCMVCGILVPSVVLCCAQLPSCVQLFVTPWTVTCQASLSIGLVRQEF